MGFYGFLEISIGLISYGFPMDLALKEVLSCRLQMSIDLPLLGKRHLCRNSSRGRGGARGRGRGRRRRRRLRHGLGALLLRIHGIGLHGIGALLLLRFHRLHGLGALRLGARLFLVFLLHPICAAHLLRLLRIHGRLLLRASLQGLFLLSLDDSNRQLLPNHPPGSGCQQVSVPTSRTTSSTVAAGRAQRWQQGVLNGGGRASRILACAQMATDYVP
jgi:hypothetical protein